MQQQDQFWHRRVSPNPAWSVPAQYGQFRHSCCSLAGILKPLFGSQVRSNLQSLLLLSSAACLACFQYSSASLTVHLQQHLPCECVRYARPARCMLSSASVGQHQIALSRGLHLQHRVDPVNALYSQQEAYSFMLCSIQMACWRRLSSCCRSRCLATWTSGCRAWKPSSCRVWLPSWKRHTS